jgi:hypothetical protein
VTALRRAKGRNDVDRLIDFASSSTPARRPHRQGGERDQETVMTTFARACSTSK